MIERWFTETFYPVTVTQAATFPHGDVETLGSAFSGAIAEYDGREPFVNGRFAAQVTHVIACPASVAAAEAMRIRHGLATYEVKWVRTCNVRAGHHLQLYCEEKA